MNTISIGSTVASCSTRTLEKRDSEYINYLRGASILRVVLVHLGLQWIFLPYSSYIGIFLPVLFFCSGYLFSYLFLKRRSTHVYLFTRVLGILIPFYLLYFSAVFLSSLIMGDWENISLGHFIRALIIAPSSHEMPYPLGQIWYLRVLIFCTFISPFVFLAAQYHKHILLLPVLVAAVLVSIQSAYPIHEHFSYFGHNFFQSIVYGAYFFIGSFIFNINWRDKPRELSYALIGCLMVSLISLFLSRGSLNLADHAYAPDLFFFSLGIVGILLCLVCAKPLHALINQLPPLKYLFLYCSNHSYGVYLIHSFLIVFVENQFGWVNVGSQPILMISKIIFVIAFSMILAYPITKVSKFITRLIQKKLNVK